MSGVQLNQDSFTLVDEGERRRKSLYVEYLQDGNLPAHQSKQSPVTIAVEQCATVEPTVPDGDMEDDDLLEEFSAEGLPC